MYKVRTPYKKILYAHVQKVNSWVAWKKVESVLHRVVCVCATVHTTDTTRTCTVQKVYHKHKTWVVTFINTSTLSHVHYGYYLFSTVVHTHARVCIQVPHFLHTCNRGPVPVVRSTYCTWHVATYCCTHSCVFYSNSNHTTHYLIISILLWLCCSLYCSTLYSTLHCHSFYFLTQRFFFLLDQVNFERNF